MTAPLTVHNAEIKTAAVEIKTLTISGKQVTLAVFRQLREEPLIAGDGALNGVPWGTVNYHPDKCGDETPHLHVVWQRGSDLLRSRVDQPWEEFDKDSPHSPAGIDHYVQAAFCHHGHRCPPEMQRSPTYGSGYAWLTIDGIRCRAVRPKWHGPDCPQAGRAPEMSDRLADYIAAEKAFRAAYKSQWKALNDLPQLFIAV